MKRKVSRNGKIVIAILLLAAIVFTVESLAVQAKNEAKAEIHSITLEPLSFTITPYTKAEKSPFWQAKVKDERAAKETARKEAVARQNAIDREHHVIYLTFDDGPSNVAEELLDLLDSYHMKATFFMLGPNMKAHPQSVIRMRDAGHGLGLHGITHAAGKIYSNPDAPASEMAEDQSILENVTGVHSNLIRLPYGSIPYLTEEMRDRLDGHDFKIWDWNIDSRDWELQDRRYVALTEQAIDRFMSAGISPVVLLHDKPQTIEYLPELLSYIQKHGYQTKVLTNEQAPVTFPCNGRCHSING